MIPLLQAEQGTAMTMPLRQYLAQQRNQDLG